MASLLYAIQVHGGDADVYDWQIGYGRAWVLSAERDVMELVLERIASETAFLNEDGPDLIADLWSWCEEHLDTMEAFGREWNHEGAQIDNTDDGLCNAVTTVQQLATGDYPEDAYRWLADRLGVAL